ncbi:MAG: FGGY family carbohydrate kinase [Carboxylicivirga sp.]|nr:FGGY family carbohydrate kinase [Carboxylicivirga sp.]
MEYIIAYDLGTGGCKASLYDKAGHCVADSFIACETYFPAENCHEQKPSDWWNAIIDSTDLLKQKSGVGKEQIKAIGISGHSLGCVPLDKNGQEILTATPIWSDSRPTEKELNPFFDQISEDEWYQLTGNGFPPALYTVFKILWYKNNSAELFKSFDKILGTKDYINYRLTGVVASDYSYASGTGVFDLENNQYSDRLIDMAGLEKDLFPKLYESDQVIGTLSKEAAEVLRLTTSVQVVAGGVDNSCMALGAKCYKDGALYASLGSSAWIAVSSAKPVISTNSKPYVFAHCVKGQYVSATAIFSSGTSLNWVVDNMTDFDTTQPGVWQDIFNEMESAPIGANGLLFNPSMAGGSSLDEAQGIRGAFLGMDLKHKRADFLRATIEGMILGLGKAHKELSELVELDDEVLLVGGGSKASLSRQIYADVFNKRMVKTSIDQQAAAFGATALAGVGIGFYKDYSIIDKMHELIDIKEPVTSHVSQYEKVWEKYEQAMKLLAQYSLI